MNAVDAALVHVLRTGLAAVGALRADVMTAKAVGSRAAMAPRRRSGRHEARDAVACAETASDDAEAENAVVEQEVTVVASSTVWMRGWSLAETGSQIQEPWACPGQVLVQSWRI